MIAAKESRSGAPLRSNATKGTRPDLVGREKRSVSRPMSQGQTAGCAAARLLPPYGLRVLLWLSYSKPLQNKMSFAALA